MSVSRQEEIISVLWIIAALIAFGNGYATWGWVFAIKGGTDTAISIWIGAKEAIAEAKAKSHNAELTGRASAACEGPR